MSSLPVFATFFVPTFPLDRNNSVSKFLEGLVAPSLIWGHVYRLEVVSSGSISPLLGISANIVTIGYWEPIPALVCGHF